MLSVVQELLGATEVASLIGVTRQRVHQLAKEPGFPEPVARLTLGAVWRTEDVQRWIQEHRPDGGSPAPTRTDAPDSAATTVPNPTAGPTPAPARLRVVPSPDRSGEDDTP